MLTKASIAGILIFVPSEQQAPIAQLDRAFDYESKGHRFESCWVHHKPPTSFALLAVVFYSFVFPGIAWFLIGLSRALASFEEVEVRDFLLYFGTNFQVFLMKSGDLAQILAQTRPRHARFFLMLSMFLGLILGTNLAQMPLRRPETRYRSSAPPPSPFPLVYAHIDPSSS